MTTNSFYLRNMLLHYDKQLVTARRLARYRQAMRLASGEEESAIPPEVKRRFMVERVAREIMENLLLAGSDNPVVREIRQKLEQELGETLTFTYPPTQLDIQVFRAGPEGPVEVAPAEKARILDRLWHIALETVDETML